jgi:aldose 1-epimerase
MSPAHDLTTATQDGFQIQRLSSAVADLEAGFAPGAGMVGCSLRHRGEELLELRGGLSAYAEKGSTMGIPLLHPWANRLAGFSYSVGGETVELDRDSPLLHLDPNGLSIHGLLAGSPWWKVVEAEADDGSARLTAALDFGAHPELLEAFPFPHRLEMAVGLTGNTLTIGTTVTATGDRAVPVSFGYHPYFRLPGVPREEWHIELPVRSRFVLDDQMIPTGETEPVEQISGPLGEQDFDDGYASLDEPARFVLEGVGRRIEVSFLEGYPFAQVYSPRDQSLICYEPMTAPTNALTTGGPHLPLVPPGESYSAVFAVFVS